MFPLIAKNTLIQLIGRAGVAVLTLLSTALLTRYFGPAGYGNYVFITAYLMLFVALADWGTGMISVREASQDKEKEKLIFGNILLVRLFLAVGFFLLSNFIARVVPLFSSLQTPLFFGSFLVLFLSLRTSLNVVFQTKLSFEKIALVEFSQSLFFFLFLIYFLPKASYLENIFAGISLCGFASAFLAFYLAKRMTGFDFRLDKKILYHLFWESLPTGAFLIVFSIYNRVDTIILQGLKGPEAVGYYGLAYKVHDNLILVAAYLMNSLFPIIAKINKEKLKEVYRETFSLLFGLGIAVVVFVLLFAPFIVFVIAGKEFGESASVLRLLIFATGIAFLNHLTGYTLIAIGKQKTSLFIALFALILNVFLNFLLIPWLSYFGAAIVTIATEGFVLILTSYYLAQNNGLKPVFSFLKTAHKIVKTKGRLY